MAPRLLALSRWSDPHPSIQAWLRPCHHSHHRILLSLQPRPVSHVNGHHVQSFLDLNASHHLPELPWGVVTLWPPYLFDILFQVSEDSPRISTQRRFLRALIFRAKQIVVQSVANEENAFQLVTPRPFRRSIRRLRVLFLLRTLFTPLNFASGPVVAYALGKGVEVDRTNLVILVILCLSTIVHPISAWYTYHLGERVKVKDFRADYLASTRALELKLAAASSVAGMVTVTSPPMIMVAFAATWVGAVCWIAVRNARDALFPTGKELEESLSKLTNHLDGADSKTIELSGSGSTPASDTECKACSGPIRVIEKSQLLDPPDTDFSRSFSRAFDEAVKRELVKRREVNAEYE